MVKNTQHSQKEQNKDMHINFSGTLTIIITLLVMVFTYDTSSKTINWGTTIFYIMLYFVLALTTGEFKRAIESGVRGIFQNLKNYMKKIYYGKISPTQAFWIFCYIAYRILISTNFFNIQMPFNIIITIGFVMGLSLTNKRIRTITETFKDVFIMNPLERLLAEEDEVVDQKICHTVKGKKIIIKKCESID